MKTQPIYIAEDGSRFDDDLLCLRYEGQCHDLERAISRLRPIPKDDGYKFANGSGYIQQDKETVLTAYREVLYVAFRAKIVSEQTVEKFCKEFASMSILGRYMDDSGHLAAYKAWHRFMCIDDQWREWGQPYYARNPKHGTQAEISTLQPA